MKRKRHHITAKSAAAILEHYYHARPQSISQIHGGLENYVFEAKVRGKELIVRISNKPNRLQFFLKEQWAVRKAREFGVPVPEILEVGNELDGMPYMILEKISGQGGDTFGNRLQTLQSLATYTRKINSIPTSGFGHVFDWSRNRLSRNKTWADFLEDELGIDDRLELFRKQKIFAGEKLRKIESAIRDLKRLNFVPRLNHGDIRLKNVILDETGRIKAIIDWENCLSGPAPQWDLSIALHDLSIDEKEAFVKNYGLAPPDFEEIAPALKTLNVLSYGKALAKAVAKKDAAQVRHIKSRLNGAFDLFVV